jgi:predicted nucleic acid-binding protein
LPSQKKKRPRGVIDTSVLVAGIAAFKTPAPANLVSSAIMLRQWIENGTFTWLVNEEILDEYKAILARRKVRSNLIGTVINLIRSAAEEAPSAGGHDISPDPFDKPFCTCAEDGSADFVVTLNPDDFPQHKLKAHVISPDQPLPTTKRARLQTSVVAV